MRFPGEDEDFEDFGPAQEAINFSVGMKDRVTPEAKKIVEAHEKMGREAEKLQGKTEKLGTSFGLTHQQMAKAVKDAALKQSQTYKAHSELLKDTQKNYEKLYKAQFAALGNFEKLSPQLTNIVRKWAKEHNLALADAKPVLAQVLTDREVEKYEQQIKRAQKAEKELAASVRRATGGGKASETVAAGEEPGVMSSLKGWFGGEHGGGERGSGFITSLIHKVEGLSGESIIGGILGIQALRASFQWDEAMTKIRRQIGMTTEEYKTFSKTANYVALKENLLPEEAERAVALWSKLGQTFGTDEEEITTLGRSLANLTEAAGLNDDQAKQLLSDYSAYAKTAKDYDELTQSMTEIAQATTLTHGEMIGVYSAAKPFARLVKEMGGDTKGIFENFGKSADTLKQKGLNDVFGEWKLGERQTALAAHYLGNMDQRELVARGLMGKRGEDVSKIAEAIREEMGLKQGAQPEEIARAIAGGKGWGITQQWGFSNEQLMQLLAAPTGPVAKGGVTQEAAFGQARVRVEEEGAGKVRSFSEEMRHVAGDFDNLSIKVLQPGVIVGTEWVAKLNEISKAGGSLDDFKKGLKDVIDKSIEYFDTHGGAAGKAAATTLRGTELAIDHPKTAAALGAGAWLLDKMGGGLGGLLMGAGAKVGWKGLKGFGSLFSWGGKGAKAAMSAEEAMQIGYGGGGAATGAAASGLVRSIPVIGTILSSPWMYLKGLNLIEKFQKTGVGGTEKDWEQGIYQRFMPWGPHVKTKMSDKELHAVNMMRMGGAGGKILPFRPVGVEGSSALSRAPKEYAEAIVAAAKRHGLDAETQAAQLELESGWNPRAVGTKGERGLGQFMSGTKNQRALAAKYGLVTENDFFDPMKSIEANAAFMQDLIRQNGSYSAALQAYNTGKVGTSAGLSYEAAVLKRLGTNKTTPMHVSVQDDLLKAIQELPVRIAREMNATKPVPAPDDRYSDVRKQRQAGG